MGSTKCRELLDQRAQQFRSIQKRLLTKFKDKNPSPLQNLDTLLEGTYRQVLSWLSPFVYTIINSSKSEFDLNLPNCRVNSLKKLLERYSCDYSGWWNYILFQVFFYQHLNELSRYVGMFSSNLWMQFSLHWTKPKIWSQTFITTIYSSLLCFVLNMYA